METIYAVLLLHKGSQEINEESLKRVLSAACVQVEDEIIDKVVNSLIGKDIDEILKTGFVMPVAPVQEEIKEEVKEPEVDEDEPTSLTSLFG